MATRIIDVNSSVAANGSNVELGGSPLAPPTGLKWTGAEFRPYFTGEGFIRALFDTEEYWKVRRKDVVQYGTPHVGAIDIVQPHKLVIQGTDLSGAINEMGATIVVEESPVTG